VILAAGRYLQLEFLDILGKQVLGFIQVKTEDWKYHSHQGVSHLLERVEVRKNQN
jgi:hypothetical protein